MKILFITRKYPPQVGGMESFSYGLINNIQCEHDTVILNKSQKHLIWWLPYAFIIGLVKSYKVDVVHLGDALLAPLGWLIKIISRKKIVVTAHGLDVTYKNYLYQKIFISCLKKLDQIICVSDSTKQECLIRGVNENKIVVIPDGVNINKFQISNSKIRKSEKKILLTVGRLVKRKGVAWFIKEVMPKLGDDVRYLIVGSGEEQQNIKNLITDDRVELLGRVSNEKLKELYNTADLFIMPNIHVKGDREGFGIVAIEAASVGLPVVASGIEGIKDAIVDNKNGFLVESGNSQAFADKVITLINSDLGSLKQQIKAYTAENYSWQVVCKKYFEAIDK